MICVLMLFVLFGLVHLARGTSTNLTSSTCPTTDGTTRSVWSILGSCALTLLICVWHALHPDVPKPELGWKTAWLKRVGFVVMSFFAPEVVVARAGEEWCKAHCMVREFREKGYEWSMAHSHFAQMDGFVYSDDHGNTSTIDADKFLELCREGKIANPRITEKEIKGWGKSDAVGKAIFTLQLFWFGLQVVVRGSQGLAITLVELDTLCMAVLALVYLFFWWDKPLRPDSPHVFCWTPAGKVYSPKELSNAWKSQPSFWHTLLCIRKAPSIVDRETSSAKSTNTPVLAKPGKLTASVENMDAKWVLFISLVITWIILGALHLVAWNFEYPTERERSIWRIASLILVGSSPAMFIVLVLVDLGKEDGLEWVDIVAQTVMSFVAISAIVSRGLLVGLMLASLRALPCSAYDTVPWTAYIPHL